jgi:hypothetical protein
VVVAGPEPVGRRRRRGGRRLGDRKAEVRARKAEVEAPPAEIGVPKGGGEGAEGGGGGSASGDRGTEGRRSWRGRRRRWLRQRRSGHRRAEVEARKAEAAAPPAEIGAPKGGGGSSASRGGSAEGGDRGAEGRGRRLRHGKLLLQGRRIDRRSRRKDLERTTLRPEGCGGLRRPSPVLAGRPPWNVRLRQPSREGLACGPWGRRRPVRGHREEEERPRFGREHQDVRPGDPE